MTENTFLRFALVGVANTAVGYGVILLFQYALGAPPVAANLAGYSIGSLLSYGLNRLFVFQSRRTHLHALPRFGAATVGCFLLNLLVLQSCIGLGMPAFLAQALAVMSYTISFYFVNRFLVFRG